MGLQSLTILAVSVAVTVLMLRFKPFRGWVRGFSLAPFGAILLCLLFFGTLFLGGERSAGDELLDNVRLARIGLFSVITGFAWVDLFLSRRTAAPINAVSWIMFGYAAFAMATASYSLNPTLTLWKGFEVVAHVSVVAVLSKKIGDVDDALSMLGLSWIVLSFISISLIVSTFIAPKEALQQIQSGITVLHGVAITVNPNTGAQIGGLLLLVAVSYMVTPSAVSNRLPVLVLLVCSASVMLLTHSRTSIFATAVTLCVIAVYARKLWILFVVLVLFAILAFFGNALEFVTDYILRGQSEEQFRGLTGRLTFWQTVWSAFIEKPILGYGFYAAIRTLYGVPGADNTYLQVLMSGGIVLMAIFLPAIFIPAIQIVRTRPTPQVLRHRRTYFILWIQTFSLFALLVIRSITGPSFEAHHINLTLFLMCAIAASALVRFRPPIRAQGHAKPPAPKEPNQSSVSSAARYQSRSTLSRRSQR